MAEPQTFIIAPSTGQTTPKDDDDPSAGSTPSYIQFTPKRAMSSFENLVALANHQERIREARKLLWRDRGEPVVELANWRACLDHAVRGGLRAGTLAFNLRASVNLVLALLRVRNVSKDLRFSLIRHAVLGTDTFRFAAMLGTFVSTYKFLINFLPLLIPSKPTFRSSPFEEDEDIPSSVDLEAGFASRTQQITPIDGPTSATTEVPLSSRTSRLSLSTKAQMILIRKKTKRWHAVLAGAVAGGLAIMWEAKARRTVIAQQMFVRGLQGSYNAFTTKRGLRVPNGDVMVFSFACGQILYGFLLRPDTLPRSYITWIGQASKVPLECVRMNKDLVREGTFAMKDLDKLIARKDITPANLTSLLSIRASPTDIPRYAPCAAVHPFLSSCKDVPLDRFLTVFKWMLPIYGALHFIPAILFRRHLFMKSPAHMFLKAGWGTMRSSAFLGVFVSIYQTAFCIKHNLHAFLTAIPASSPFKVPQHIVDILISKGSFWFAGLLSGLSLFVEERRRRGELAMYVLPKGLESLWVMARGKGLVFKTGNYGEMLLTAIGMGMVMSTYQNDPQHLSGLVRRILYQFVGPN